MEEVRRRTELFQNSRSPDQDLNPRPSEKKAVVLLNTLQGSVKISSSNMTCRRSQWPRDLKCGDCGCWRGWDCGFESRLGHGCLSLVSVVCYQVEAYASGWLLLQGSPTECGVSEYDRDLLIKRRPWPIRDCWELEEQQHWATESINVKEFGKHSYVWDLCV